MIRLERIKRTDPRLLSDMEKHYSQPRGFVGRNLCYAVTVNDVYYGGIVGGSATLHLVGRDEFFGNPDLREVINNIFFHIEKKNGRYPIRNMAEKTLGLFRRTVSEDWEVKYHNRVIGFETLVELPRTGEVYRRDGWTEVGVTKGYTCKRTAGKGTDSWSGKRVWDVENLRPKRVFVRWN